MLDFMIIGAQKSATSALQTALRAWPGVEMPSGESPYFEDPEFRYRPWEGLCKRAAEGAAVGIKRPDILCSDLMRERVLDTHPNVRLIAVLREPVGRAVSAYYHLVRHAELPMVGLNRGLAQCLDDFEQRRATLDATVIENGLYGRHLQRWLSNVSRERVLVLSQKQVAADSSQVLGRVLAHIGASVGEGAQPQESIGHNNVGIYDPALLRLARVASLIKTRPMAGSWRRAPRVVPLRAAGILLSRATEHAARIGGRQGEPLSEDIRGQLERIYRQDAAILRRYVDPELVYWN